MTNGVLSLDDIQASSNDGSSTDAETNTPSGSGDSGTDPLETACETLGANYEHAKAYVEEHGNKEDLLGFAQRLADDEDLWESQVEYRVMNDIHRIIRKWLRSHELEFTAFTGQFYGDSDDPEPGTYNYVQQQSRENEGNLMFYRALFPTPVGERWDSQPVLWHEFDEIGYAGDLQDSHIYVTEDFATEYADYAITINGDSRPRPPANSELNSGGSDTSGSASNGGVRAFDPAEFTIGDLEDELETVDYSVEQLERVLEQEKSPEGKNRKGAKNAIRNAIDTAESNDSDSSDDGGSAAQAAGEMTAEGESIPPEKVKELMEDGWDKDEIIALYG